MSAHLTLTNTLSDELRETAALVRDKTAPLTAFAEWWHAEMLTALAKMTYAILWPNGAWFRPGIWWRAAADLYRRASGERIPPWGGVPRIRKPKGAVKGRKRHSGTRVTRASWMMQDNGTLLQDFLTAPEIGPNKDILTWSVVTDYAEEQNGLRPYNQFSLPTDETKLTEIYRQWLEALFQARQQYGDLSGRAA